MPLIDSDKIDLKSLPMKGDYLLAVRELIDEQPVVDAEPVIHAYWDYNGPNGSRGFRCSHCHLGVISRSDYYSSRKRNYCYNCGAKMDKESISTTLNHAISSEKAGISHE